MSVQKLNNKSKSFAQIVPFAQISLHVINNIKNADAFLVWCYLSSKTENWIVIKSHVKQHFRFGERKMIGIFKYLNKRKLIEYVAHRDAQTGQFAHVDIQVLDGTNFITDQQLNKCATALSKTRTVDNRMYGFDSTTINRDIRYKEKALNTHASQNDAQESDSSFDQFWNMYPKKKDKKRCKEKFAKIPLAIIALILVKLEQQVKEDQQWKELRFVPYPSTYLENERWMDDIFKEGTANLANSANPINKNHSPQIRSTVQDWGPGHPGYDSIHGIH
jgi:hypothetical protein